MRKLRAYRLPSILLAVALIFGISSMAACVDTDSERDGQVQMEHFTAAERAILEQTLGTPLGMYGFTSEWGDDPHEIVEIVVQFRTPP